MPFMRVHLDVEKQQLRRLARGSPRAPRARRRTRPPRCRSGSRSQHSRSVRRAAGSSSTMMTSISDGAAQLRCAAAAGPSRSSGMRISRDPQLSSTGPALKLARVAELHGRAARARS